MLPIQAKLLVIVLFSAILQVNAGPVTVKKIPAPDFFWVAGSNAVKSNDTGLQGRVTGRVTDEEGKPISGVSVFIKNSKTGTITDVDGNFSLGANKGDVLVFSSVGYKKKEMIIGGDVVSVQLEVFISPLSQVVVSGNMMEIQRKADISSVTVLTAKDLQNMPGQTIDRLLTGVIPGVTITSVGNQESLTYSTVQIRGAGSMLGGEDASQEPVKVYVDGVQFAAGVHYLAMLNKDNVDRIEVVRGASAAAIYGSGANGGVILIFTKKGRTDKTTIDVTTSAGFQNSPYVKRPFQQSHNIEISQGIKNFGYSIGGNYRTQQDYLPHGSLTATSTYANFRYRTGKFNFELNSSYNTARMLNSWKSVYDDIPDPYKYFLLEKTVAYYKNHTDVNTGTVALHTTFKPTPWWTHDLVIGYTKNQYPAYTDGSVLSDTALLRYYTVNGNGLYFVNINNNDYTKNLRYANTISLNNRGNTFRINILSGFEYSKYDTRYNATNMSVKYARNTGYRYQPYVYDANDPLLNHAIENSSGFLQLAPSIKDKYFFVAAVRYNASNVSKPAFNPRVGFTASFNAGGFILKPRINYGIGISSPPYAAKHPRANTSGSPNVTYLANPDIKQQDQRGPEYALEVYSNDGKIKAEIIRYDNVVTNGFLFQTIKRPITGYPRHVDVIWINTGKYTNKGWEFSASYGYSNFKVSGNYSVIKSVYVDSFNNYGKVYFKGDKVAYSPGYSGGLFLNYNCPKIFGKADRFSATVGMVSSGKMYAHDYYAYSVASSKIDPNGPDPYPDYDSFYITTPGITKFNFSVEYQFHPLLKCFVQAENFTNNTTPDWDRSKPVSGASWLFGMKLNFIRNKN